MDAAHIHLVVNHVPILLTFISLLILAWGWLRSNETLVNLSLLGYVVAGIFAYIAYQSGHAAEEIVEDLAGVSHDLIEQHEHAAEWSLYLAILQGIVALISIGMYKAKSTVTRYLIPLLWVFSLYVAGNFFYTGYTGGQIRHTEIRPDSAVQTTISGEEQESEEHED